MTTKKPKKRPRKKVGAQNIPLDVTKEVLETRRLKQEAEAAQERYDRARQDLLDKLQDSGRKTITVEDGDGTKLKATVVRGSNLHVVEERLKKALGAQLWKKVSVQKLDRKLLEDKIASGEVDPTVVAECTVETVRKPFVKIT